MGQNKYLAGATGYTMSNEFSANGMSKVTYGKEYTPYEKFEDEPGQVNIFETSEEFFDWTGALAESCQAIAVDARNLLSDLGLVIGLGSAKLASKAAKGEFSGSVRDMISQFLGAVVDDQSMTGKELGDLGKHFDMLMKELNGFGDIIGEHVDVNPWLSAGTAVKKVGMAEFMASITQYLRDNRNKTDLAKALEAALNLGGFRYVEYIDESTGVYESTIDALIQQSSGFSDWIDSIGAAAGMDIKDQIIVFQEGGYEYRVELWKGSYAMGGTTGAEIGIYRRPLSEANDDPYEPGEKNYYIHYEVVPADKYCEMSYTLYDNGAGEVVFTRDTRNDSQEGDKGWWPLTMRAGYVSDKEDLVMEDVTIEFWNMEAAKGFEEALRENYKMKVDRTDLIVKYTWGDKN